MISHVLPRKLLFPLWSFILLLPWDSPFSHDTMTKKNAYICLVLKIQSRLYASVLFLKAPCTHRTQQDFVGLDYLPELD